MQVRLPSWLLIAASPLCACVCAAERPNFIVILADDLGYSDIGSFSAQDIDTLQLNRMAKEGRRFTDFYVGGPACTPSRAALMTGCYPVRAGFADAIAYRADGGFSHSRVLWPNSKFGINGNEVTIPEVLRIAGYATGIVGKWHLGDQPQFNPVNHGFDEFFGAPYSHDMKPYYYMRGNERLTEKVNLNNHVRRYTDEAIAFIRKHKDEPFFLYLPHHMPHTPLVASEAFEGKSKRGPYGDSVSELDWGVGQVLDALRELKLDKRTLVIFTSDNGPWLVKGEQGGSARPLRGGKGTTYEGGVRVPCVMWWPGTIRADTTCREVAATMDFLPTFAALAGASLPADHKIDGHNIFPLMTDDAAKSPWKALYYFLGNELHAVRSGPWKLRAKNNFFNEDIYRKAPAPRDLEMPAALYHLRSDPGEQKSVLLDHPKIARRLERYLNEARADLGDSLTGVKPANARPPGRAE
jgi:arylsulfatase A-like enzyme